jgi:hypothetical protein
VLFPGMAHHGEVVDEVIAAATDSATSIAE